MPNERKNSDFLGRDQSFDASGSEDANLQSKGEDESDGKTQSQQRLLTQHQNSRSTALETPLTNIALSHKLIAELYGLGVSEWIVCAGARNAPLIKALNLYRSAESSEDCGSDGGLGDKVCRREERRGEDCRGDDYRGSQLTVIHFFEERSAGFFAIGRAKRSGTPVAVLTTSGTAVAELLPAMMEATYSGIPIVMVSADRPSSYWGTGAPQTVWQPGIFTNYSNPTICWDCHQQPRISLVAGGAKPDLQVKDDGDSHGLNGVPHRLNRPSHINISFDEPLIDAPVETGYLPLSLVPRVAREEVLEVQAVEQRVGLADDGDAGFAAGSTGSIGPGSTESVRSSAVSSGLEADAEKEASYIAQFKSESRAPLVLLASLSSEEAATVKPHLLRLQLPIYAEAHSQLREDAELGAYIIRCGEGLFNQRSGHPRAINRSSGHLPSSTSSSAVRSDAQSSLCEEIFDSVIRIGGIPTTRLWRNLESSLSDWPVLSFSSLPFSGLARLKAPPLPLEALDSLWGWDELERSLEPKKRDKPLKCSDKIRYYVPNSSVDLGAGEEARDGSDNLAAAKDSKLLERSLGTDERAKTLISNGKFRYHVPKTYAEELLRLLARYPQSEPGWIRRISRVVPAGSMVFLGNSLPIREWDLAAEYPEPLAGEALAGVSLGSVSSARPATGLTILGNRGVNGIDGLVSTFLGAARPDRENWLIIGDLSAAYDLAGLGLIDHMLPQTILRIVLINNGGGMIFNRLFKDPAFENSHQILFKPWAEMFGIDYRRNEDLEAPNLPQRSLIEIVPDPESTDRFWNSYEDLFL